MCNFCSPDVIESQKISENELSCALLPLKPVIIGHVLIIPKRHVAFFTDMSSEELNKVQALIKKIFWIYKEHLGMTGFNLMSNNGKVAGQHIPHAHVHMFLRKPDEKASPFDILSKKGGRINLSSADWSLLLTNLREWSLSYSPHKT